MGHGPVFYDNQVEVGLADSISVILSNLAIDEGRKVYFNEIEKMGKKA